MANNRACTRSPRAPSDVHAVFRKHGPKLQRILEEQRRQDEKRRVKRAANRKSASTSRARKKALIDEMTAKNERMKQHALILSMLPDLVLAVCRSGEMTYVSPAAKWLLHHSPEEVTGANIFELVTPDCHALLRTMISDNLARPVVSRTLSSDESAGRSSESGSSSGGDSRRPTMPQGNHRDRLQQRYLKGKSPALSEGAKGAGNGGSWPCNASSQGGAKMLRLIRCDKTTVWCETSLSVRTSKDDSNPTPIEIILTLRTVSEGNMTTAGNGLPSSHRTATREGPTASATAAGVIGLEDAECEEEDDDDDNDDDGHVEDDDDGYRCEQEEDESNNSGSGNDAGGVRPPENCGADGVSKKQKLDPGGTGSSKKSEEVAPPPTGGDSTGALEEGREEGSLLRIKNMGMFDSTGAGEDGSKGGEGGEGGEDSSTGGDTGGSTTHEGSASCSNEADSNGEGSNTGSKWGEACRSNGSGDSGASEDGSSDGSSAERDLGDEVQNAVQSLILMGGSFGNDGEGSGGGGESETTP